MAKDRKKMLQRRRAKQRDDAGQKRRRIEQGLCALGPSFGT